MNAFRVSLGLAASVAVHVGSVMVLRLPPPVHKVEHAPAMIDLAALPPPVEKPAPETPHPPPPPKEPKPELPRPTKSAVVTPRSAPIPADVHPSQPPAEPQPLVLAGLSMSNAGVAVSNNYASSNTSSPVAHTQSEPSNAMARTKAPQLLTPVSDLSKRPVPPKLDAALSRFYPPHLRSQGVEGEALIRVVLGKDGRVTQTTAVSESNVGFGRACENALRTSEWEPPVDKAGNPTMTSLKYRCRFRVNL